MNRILKRMISAGHLRILCWSLFYLSLLYVLSSLPTRGLNASGLTQVMQAEGVLDRFNGGPSDSATARGGLIYGPLNGLLPAFLSESLGGGEALERWASFSNSLWVLLILALCIVPLARRLGGEAAAVVAMLSWISIPRVWSIGSSADLSGLFLLLFTGSAISMVHARDRTRWLLPAVLLSLSTLFTSQLSIYLLIPWLALTFIGIQEPGLGGKHPVRPLGVSALLFPLLLFLGYLLFRGALWPVSEVAFGEYLASFFSTSFNETLYWGEIYREHRLPWHSGLVLTLVTVPTVILVFSFSSIFCFSGLRKEVLCVRNSAGDHEDTLITYELLKLCLLMTGLTMLFPFLLGRPDSNGIDLLSLQLPWLCVLSGVGFSLILNRLKGGLNWSDWKGMGTGRKFSSGLPWLVVLFALITTLLTPLKVSPHFESYYSPLIGGESGASTVGFPLNPRAAVPPTLIDILHEPGEAAQGISILPEKAEDREIIRHYARAGWIDESVYWDSPDRAQILILRHEHSNPEFYERVDDYYHAAEQAVIQSEIFSPSGMVSVEGILLPSN